MSKESFYANGTIKIKNADGVSVPFYPKTKTDCIYDYQTSKSLSTVISEMESSIEIAANSGGVKVSYDEINEETAEEYTNETLIACIDYPAVSDDTWQYVVDTRVYGSAGTNAKTAIPFSLYNQYGITLTVDWGDGNVETLTSADYEFSNSTASEHTYANPGVYTIKIKSSDWSNTYFQIDFFVTWGEPPEESDTKTGIFNFFKNTIIRIESKLPGVKGVREWGIGSNSNRMLYYENSLKYLFYMCVNLTSIVSSLFDNCTNITNFSKVFGQCAKLKSIPSNLFNKCINANDFSSCFSSCESIKTIPAHLFDFCVNATTFGESLNGCFYSCKSLITIPQDLFKYNIKVTSFQYCFSGCSKLQDFTLRIGSPIVTNVKNFISSKDGAVRIIYVPSGSTTETTFNSIASSSGLTIIGE